MRAAPGSSSGRISLRLEDYRAWEAREVEDELGVLDGILISSWNDWIETHTGDGGAMLAGIRIDKLVAPIDPSEFVVCPSRDDVRTPLQMLRSFAFAAPQWRSKLRR